MGEYGEGIDLFAVEEDVELDEVGALEAVGVIVEGGVAFGDALEFVVEVDDYLAEGQVEDEFHTVAGDELLLDEVAALGEAEGHDGTDVLGGGDDAGADDGFLDVVDLYRLRHAGGVVYLADLALLGVYEIGYVGDGGDDVHVELAVQAFLHYLHVEQTEKSAAEAEAQGGGRLGREAQGGIVELEFLERGAQVFKLLRLDGVDAGEDHRFDFLEAGDG